MFYSQFILAKKGPLGTIWIAAHLERKLRKNQVADTDIGVSVDSILFPDMPIALRLSSHLLLGVVRIYSRKVNYLFDDCSEALLKIKQAFRSTAVDLPPEESTAPYHSITLPETFDLDDFELPDNELFQGNYVDHHVSTRDQITLQDTMDGIVYSTSQFGLDERFGDGDTSQIGLDLDEELILRNVNTDGHLGVSEEGLQACAEHVIGMENKNSVILHRSDFGIQVKDQAVDLECIDFTHAPSTPGLVEEPNLSSVQEVLGCDDQLEVEDENLQKLVGLESHENVTSNLDLCQLDMNFSVHNETNDDIHTHSEENGCRSGGIEIDETTTAMNNLNIIKTSVDGIVDHSKLSVSSVDRTGGNLAQATGEMLNETVELPNGSHAVFASNGLCSKNCFSDNSDLVSVHSLVDDRASFDPELRKDEENVNEIEKSDLPGKVAAPDASDSIKENGDLQSEAQAPKKFDNLIDSFVNGDKSDHMFMLRACSSHLNHHSVPSPIYDDSVVSNLQSEDARLCSLGNSRAEEVLGGEKNLTRETSPCEKVQVDEERLEERQKDAISDVNEFENVNCSATPYFPEPEKMLSVPEGNIYYPSDLLTNFRTNKNALEVGDDSRDSIALISVEKPSFTMNSLAEESLKSVDTFGLTRSKRKAESVPDDDDLLSSILGGRKLSVLKMKPTPPAPEVAPIKRARMVPRVNVLKRKVLMDDAMVLHGDTIRQQLTNTEDIRRNRKKAPCTYPEISMIQRQFSEEEIFKHTILTGTCSELMYLSGKPLDVSKIEVLENDVNHVISGNAKDLDFPSITVSDKSNKSLVLEKDLDSQQADIAIQNEKQQDTDYQLCSSKTQEHENVTALEDALLGEIVEMEIDSGSIEVSDGLVLPVPGFEKPQGDCFTGDICNKSAVFESAHIDVVVNGEVAPPNTSALCMSASEKTITQPVEEISSLGDMGDMNRLDVKEVDLNVDNVNESGFELTAGDELEERKLDSSIVSEADAWRESFATTSNESMLHMTECYNLTSETGDQALKGADHVEIGIDNYDDLLNADLGASNGIITEGGDVECTDPVNFDLHVDNTSLEADPRSLTDGEIGAAHHHSVQDFQEDDEGLALENDTGFLNVDDDDDDAPEEDDVMTCADYNEHSGWSLRTRAVAKYLQVILDNEARLGKKAVSMDKLLSDKTRKEASRMFFEALVLKTKDYIHVEQEHPFDNITIKPRAKLMKSDF